MKMHDITETTEHRRNLFTVGHFEAKNSFKKAQYKYIVDSFIGLNTYLYTKSNINNYYSP